MSTSYQDIDTRLQVIEDKVDFVMKTFTVTRQESSILNPSQLFTTKMNLLDVYRELKTQGAMIITPGSKEADNGTSPDAPVQ